MPSNEYDVIIIGAGATGAGTARDCAMRGLRTLLVERDDLASGASGRNHGLLHSGARYAVSDQEGARECISENRILRRIASHCVEDTGGLFITLPGDDLSYRDKFVSACSSCGIETEILSGKEALRLDGSVNPDLISAVKVPDGSVDPFRLCYSNVLSAKELGADILFHTEVVGLIIEGDSLVGIRTRSRDGGVERAFYSKVVVNAAGVWCAKILQMAGLSIRMYPAKGSLLIFEHRVNRMVINRCRKPSNADILVPGETVSILGTTSEKVPLEMCDFLTPTPEEIDILFNEGQSLCPSLARTRILRAYSGVRPLVGDDSDPTGRGLSRGIVCLDHEKRDGLKGLVTITGGKLMTYRLMAEKAADMVCSKLGVKVECKTATTELPGSEKKREEHVASKTITAGRKAAHLRMGSRASLLRDETPVGSSIVCECEEVSSAELENAIRNLPLPSLEDLRRRVRLGMGTCQGCLCSLRGAEAISAFCPGKDCVEDLGKFLSERWKGMVPVCWGDAQREGEYMQLEYKLSLGL